MLEHGAGDAVLALHEEAAYADLGTVTPELIIRRWRAPVVILIPAPKKIPANTQRRSGWFWATAPPRRTA